MTKTLQKKLESVASKLGKSYRGWKAEEKAKETARSDFFKLATEALSSETLAEKIVEVEAPDQEAAQERLKKKYPSWTVDEVRSHPEKTGYFEAIIVENPELMPFTFEFDGYKYVRQVTRGSVYIDDERLQEEAPDLWEEITFIPEPKRQVRDLGELEPGVLARLQSYVYEGAPRVKLGPPTKISE